MEGVFACIQETELIVLQAERLCSHYIVRPCLKIQTSKQTTVKPKIKTKTKN